MADTGNRGDAEMEGLSFQAGDSVGELTQNLQTSFGLSQKNATKVK